MYTKGQWTIYGSKIVSVEREIRNSNETICELNPETEHPTVFNRSQKEALKNAKLIVNAPQMYEAIHEVLEMLDGNGIPNIEWIRNRLYDAIS